MLTKIAAIDEYVVKVDYKKLIQILLQHIVYETLLQNKLFCKAK